jgi:hypothetical protein
MQFGALRLEDNSLLIRLMDEKRHKAVLRVSLIELLCQEAQSIFRDGFDHLRHILLNLDEYQANFRQSLQSLSCT